MKNELRNRAAKAASRYLEMQGMEIVDKAWSKDDLAGRIDIVAHDGFVTVFANVSVATTGADLGFREEPVSREQLELLAAEWMGEHADDIEPNTPVRFDKIAILVCSEDRALLRHHVNCFGDPGAIC